MQEQWMRCCACGAVTDFNESYCPARCKNSGKTEIISFSLEELIKLLSQGKIWTKRPDSVNSFL